METINASDAKREFGDLLLKAQHEPIGINKNGKPIAVVLSVADYAQLEALREERLKAAILEGIDHLNTGKVSKGSDVINRLRQRIS
ncbi:type II toxin-antitoxin system Phd/YefM family antitoxin [Alkalimonas collagenimarina]|uniref:Antitoxin n=1 Tax=Alkalimonas collagenimarina TaxID=400390 RepID=A0ABT9GZS7_9GAMM|nr:type II toxin-antitoxin system Phd/YefM family antitoxin [Alkalimonas collagenimarina]MDP4536468.1 type II toxin-antitoxin system Phd/YefM family antitoxin [Alkalimonas collagenimarina]